MNIFLDANGYLYVSCKTIPWLFFLLLGHLSHLNFIEIEITYGSHTCSDF